MATTNDDSEVILIVLALLFAVMVLAGSGNKSADNKDAKKSLSEMAEEYDEAQFQSRQEARQTETSVHTWQQVSGIKRHAMNHLDEADRLLN